MFSCELLRRGIWVVVATDCISMNCFDRVTLISSHASIICIGSSVCVLHRVNLGETYMVRVTRCHIITKSNLVAPSRWSPTQLYNVISKVEDYNKFVPWCRKSMVVKRVGDSYMEAELEVGFQMLRERWVQISVGSTWVFTTSPVGLLTRLSRVLHSPIQFLSNCSTC